jgi:hypothetical protein
VLEFRLMDRAPRAASGAAEGDKNPAVGKSEPALYCPICALEVDDPLACGDCSAVICRRCGTPLESSDELGIG